MSSPTKPRKTRKKNEDYELRQKTIIKSLRHCMIKQGFAETTLTGLAREANMTVSHLLYYYPSKEAVLIDLCDELLARLQESTASGYGGTPAERIRLLAENLFLVEKLSEGEMGIMGELLSLAAHRPAIRERLTGYVDSSLEYLKDLFAHTPRQPGQSASDAAEVAAALGAGLFAQVNLDRNVDQAMARRLYYDTLVQLANLSGQVPSWEQCSQA